MPEDIAFITARRAYEFRPDDLRLSMLSIKPIQDEKDYLYNVCWFNAVREFM